ncbi:MAG: hypothetical protein JNM33_15085 [Rubrivivax sp.]|nr:hypothetical protein [Rubrivivax sp.]
MTSSGSDSIKTNVIGGVIAGAVLAVGGAVWAFAPAAWKWFTDLLASIWAHLTSAATVPTWWLYILYAISAAAVLTVALRVRAAATSTEPTFTDYTEDRFMGAVWRWRYAHGAPTGTWAFCPRCDTVLVYSYQRDYGDLKTTLHCETCRVDIATEPGDRDDLVGKVHRQIDRKIRTGEWKNYVERAAPAQT